MSGPSDFYYLVVLAAMGVSYVVGSYFASRLIAPRQPDAVKAEPYECGEIAYGPAWSRFNVGYYIFALLFLVFEIEVAFFFPWAVVLKELGWASLVAGGIFLLVLLFGLVFAWRKGYLVWH